jgi:superfamily II DNA/RNA helicase
LARLRRDKIYDKAPGKEILAEYSAANDNDTHQCAMEPEPEKRKDPRAWDALTPPLAEWILDAITAMGFGRMTPVQASTIPLFMGNKDVVVEVHTPDFAHQDFADNF